MYRRRALYRFRSMDNNSKRKRNNIILITSLAVIAVGLSAFVVYTQFIKKNTAVEVHEWGGAKYIVAEEALNRASETMEELEKYLIEGKTFTAVSASTDDAKTFMFVDDGTYYGYTTREDDDLGKWDISSESDGTYVIVTTVGATNRYKLSHNNNNDLTLVGDNNQTFVLTEKVKQEEPKKSLFDEPEETTEAPSGVSSLTEQLEEIHNGSQSEAVDNATESENVNDMVIKGSEE